MIFTKGLVVVMGILHATNRNLGSGHTIYGLDTGINAVVGYHMSYGGEDRSKGLPEPWTNPPIER
jgi:hypothetical protein